MKATLRKSADLFSRHFGWVFTVLVSAFAAEQSVHAQTQVLVETPLQQTSNGFYENFGIGWNYSNDNFFINVPNGVRPPFGMGDPNSDARIGFTGRGPGGGRFGLDFTLGQGSTRTNSVTSPMIMLPNGGTGAIFDGSVRPFVTGFIPVVGQGGGYQSISPIQQKLQQMAAEGNLESLGKADAFAPQRDGPKRQPEEIEPPRRASSSAAHGDLSVAEIRRRQANGDDAAPHTVAGKKAAALEAEGKLTSAKLQYKRAADQAPDGQRSHWVENYNRISRMLDDAKKR